MTPADVPPSIAAEADAIVRAVLEALDLVVLLCVEMFLTKDGRLLINELAPRPHNSGHLTFDAAVTSLDGLVPEQFRLVGYRHHPRLSGEVAI